MEKQFCGVSERRVDMSERAFGCSVHGWRVRTGKHPRPRLLEALVASTLAVLAALAVLAVLAVLADKLTEYNQYLNHPRPPRAAPVQAVEA